MEKETKHTERNAEVLLADLSAFGGEETEELIKCLPPERRAAILRYRSERDRARSAVGEALTRLALSRRVGVPPQSLPIFRTPEGKPVLAGGPCFNLSHSGNAVALASEDRPVGIDVEKIEETDFSAIAERYFTERERAQIAHADFPLAEFYRLWTARESALKRLGRGIPAMEGLEIVSDRAVLCGKPLEGFIRSRILTDFSEGGYALSVCTETKCKEELFTCSAREIAKAYLAAAKAQTP